MMFWQLWDAIRLNADVVNLSLGSLGGFTDESETVSKIYGKILESDVVVAIAGNTPLPPPKRLRHQPEPEDPDNGIVPLPVLTSVPPAWPVWRTPG